MTREEFIDAYIANSKIGDKIQRIEGGFHFAGHVFRALPCDCGYERCNGFWMDSHEKVEGV